MIAEICNCHAKICVTQQDNFSNSFKNQGLIPLIIGVKKVKGFNLVKQVMFQLVVNMSRFVNHSIGTDDSLIRWGSNDKLNLFLIKQPLVLDIMTCFLLNNTQERFAYPSYFSKAQSSSKLIIFLDSKLKRANLQVIEFSSRLDSQNLQGLRI